MGKSKEVKQEEVAVDKKLDAFCGSLDKKYGKGAVIKGDSEGQRDIEVISTGSLGLDIALGVGGFPRGRIVEIYGAESSGKTTLALSTIAEAQRTPDVRAGYVDMEHALNLDYAKRIGVDVSRLLFSQPDNGEQALSIAEDMITSGLFHVVVVDSVASLVPKSELTGDMGDSSVGVQARLMSSAMRKICAKVDKSNTLVIFINQLREKVGVMFGSPITTTGGNALKFYASVRIDINRIGQNKDGEEVLSNRTRAKVVKNKIAPPFKKAEFDIVFDVGINRVGEIMDMASLLEVLTKNGAYYSYGDSKLGQGRDATISVLMDNPELCEELETQVKVKLGIIKVG